MVSTWSSGSAFAPMSTDKATFPGDGNLGSFTFVDFLPVCSDRGGIFSTPEYENFRTLVDRANNWLRSNPKFELKTCESVEFTARRDKVDSEKMVYLEHGETSTRYIRGLRVWLAEASEERKGQQIGYLNLIPQQLEKRGMFSSPTFESLDDVLRRFNNMIQTNPIPGRIITVESQEMKMSYSKDVDPDRSTWLEQGSMHNRFLFVIRIFFEMSDGIPEEISMVDFTPDAMNSGGILTLPKYEPFSNVVNKASNWCMAQRGIKICNAQSLEIKMKRGQEVDTQKMSYVESGSMNTYFVRILRVVYTKPRVDLKEDSTIQKLTCKTISPVQLTHGLFIPEFETLQETKNRVSAWVKATGAQVICAETTAIRMFTGGEAKQGTEASFTYNLAERSQYFIFIIRLYINGSYYEPPPEMLPPIPEIEYQNCCLVS